MNEHVMNASLYFLLCLVAHLIEMDRDLKIVVSLK